MSATTAPPRRRTQPLVAKYWEAAGVRITGNEMEVIGLRLPLDLGHRIDAGARRHGISFHAELIGRLMLARKPPGI